MNFYSPKIRRNQPPKSENPVILKSINNYTLLDVAEQNKGMIRYGKREIDFERFCKMNKINPDEIVLTLRTILGNTYRKTLRGVFRLPERDGESIADEIIGIVDPELDKN